MKTKLKTIFTAFLICLLCLSVYASTVITDQGSVFGGNITTTGNISAEYFLGDGSLLTGIASGGDSWSDAVDSNIIPNGDNAWDIGSSSVEFKDGFFDGRITTDDLTVGQDIILQDQLIHTADTNTYVDFDTDAITIFADSSDFKLVGSTNPKTATFNTGGYNQDVNIKGDNDANLFYTDASTDKVGIGTNTPSEKLEVVGNVEISGYQRYLQTDGVISNYSNGCYQKVNSTGIYTIC